MIFPLRIDRRLRHTPWVNIAFITINVVAYMATAGQIEAIRELGMLVSSYDELAHKQPLFHFYLHPARPQWFQFFTYQFLHSSPWHLLSNMLFLYVFGNTVEDRLRPWGYAVFYLLGGAAAGAGHCLAEVSPVIGASGSVSAVTGAFLVLFPKTIVTVVFFFFVIFPFEVHSLYLILFWALRDVFFQFASHAPVAYVAHLSGSAFGFLVGVFLLATGILSREPYDLLSLIKHWNRRREFKVITARGYEPWRGPVGGADGGAEPDARQQRLLEIRDAVMRALIEHQPDKALTEYARLIELDPEQVLPRDAQHDLANHAMRAGRHPLAAHAYERFLARYPRDAAAPESGLMLGLIYARYLRDPEKARAVLGDVVERLDDPARRQLARQTLDELPS